MMTKYGGNLPIIFLKPAELYINRGPALVKTVLGSCISVTMLNRRTGIAAMCHALLPLCRKKQGCHDHCPEKYRYVGCVIPEMVQKILGFGIKKKEIEVKLFGGAETLGANKGQVSIAPVGRQNVKEAVKAIQANQLWLKTTDVGGGYGRKILFDTHSGEILLRKLNGFLT